jgi:hypothetical protein
MKILVHGMEGDKTGLLAVVASDEVGRTSFKMEKAKEMCFRNQRVFMKKIFDELVVKLH